MYPNLRYLKYKVTEPDQIAEVWLRLADCQDAKKVRPAMQQQGQERLASLGWRPHHFGLRRPS